MKEVKGWEAGVWRKKGSSSLTPSWSPEDNVDPTDAEPIEPDPVLSVSGGAAIGLLLAGNIGAVMLIGGISFTIVRSIRYVLSFTPAHCLTSAQPPQDRAHSATRQKPNR